MRYMIDLIEAAGGIFDVSVDALAQIYDPFNDPPWIGVATITKNDIKIAIKYGNLEQRPRTEFTPLTKDFHVARIAYLVAHPDPTPITIIKRRDGDFELDDGFHRLAAAIYRGDETIKAAFEGTKKQLADWLLPR